MFCPPLKHLSCKNHFFFFLLGGGETRATSIDFPQDGGLRIIEDIKTDGGRGDIFYPFR